MSNENTISADLRESFGKGAARKLRAVGKIPAVIYGHGTDPVHVSLPGHETMLIIRKANAIIELDVAGRSELVLVKDVQRDPVRQIIEHIDLIVVKKGEKVTVDVPVHVEGESAAGTIHALDATHLTLAVEATHIPENVVVSIEGLEEGTHVLASDIELPTGSELLSDPETLVVAVSLPAVSADEGDASEDEAEAPSAE